MGKSLIQEQNDAAISAACKIASGEPGLVIVVRRNVKDRYDVAAVIGGKMPLPELRDALMGAVIALGKVAEQAGNLGPVLTPETET